MSITYIQDEKALLIRPPEQARWHFYDYFSDMKWKIFLAIFLGFIYPALGLALLAYYAIDYYLNIYEEYFHPDKKYIYEQMLSVKIKPVHFIQFGYRLESSELERHLSKLDKGDIDYLKAMAYRAKHDKLHRWRLVGIDKDLLTLHLWLLGASGAGKTSTIVTGIKFQAKNGGGAVMIDGKADESMNKKFYTVLKEVDREHSYYLLNFLNVDKYKEHTNTFNPLYVLTPAETVQFISDLAGGGQGDQAYWKGRGIALLTPATYFVYFRRDHFGENFSYETIANYLEAKSFAFSGAVVYALMLDIENRLKEAKNLRYIYEQGKRIKIPESEFEFTEIFESYLAQNPQDKKVFEEEGFNYQYLEDLVKLFKSYRRYATDVSSGWWDAIREAGKKFYAKFGSSIATMGIFELRMANEEISKELEKMAQDGGGNNPLGALAQQNNPNAKYLMYSNPADPRFQQAMQQHQYAQQQWTNVFNFFGLYRHIFGVVESDIDLVDIIRNNKFLYVLLPPLKQSREVTEFLGKLLIIAISRAIATALGGPVQKTNVQDRILKKQIQPVPPFLVIADEYGAYAVPGMDIILTQARSIGISAWLSTQDITSLRVGGTDENSKNRIFGSTSTKIILSTKDAEALRTLHDILPEQEIRQISGYLDGKGIVDEFTFQTKRVPLFDPRNAQKFEKGMSFIFSNGKLVLCQMFYENPPEADRIYLTKYENVV
jgi:hypothetical protein